MAPLAARDSSLLSSFQRTANVPQKDSIDKKRSCYITRKTLRGLLPFQFDMALLSFQLVVVVVPEKSLSKAQHTQTSGFLSISLLKSKIVCRSLDAVQEAVVGSSTRLVAAQNHINFLDYKI